MATVDDLIRPFEEDRRVGFAATRSCGRATAAAPP